MKAPGHYKKNHVTNSTGKPDGVLRVEMGGDEWLGIRSTYPGIRVAVG